MPAPWLLHTVRPPRQPVLYVSSTLAYDMGRFRGSDGAFYDGAAASVEGAHALLRFARPTKPYQLAAARVPVAALLPGRAAPDMATQLGPGASVIVLPE